jgi:ribonuclease R
MLLRSLKQARYADQSLGHFGLAAPFYTHFTSPIRRYPDTMVHRLIHYYQDNGINSETKKKYATVLDEIATTTSEYERRAVDAERDTDSMKKAEYMNDHLGEEFDGVVSSVMKFGLFVELPNTVEGLVHISRMDDDYYQYVEQFMALVGRNTRRTYKMGQPIRVKVVNVDVEQSAVDFDVVNPEETPTSNMLPKRSYQHRDNNHRNNDRHGHSNSNSNNFHSNNRHGKSNNSRGGNHNRNKR